MDLFARQKTRSQIGIIMLKKRTKQNKQKFKNQKKELATLSSRKQRQFTTVDKNANCEADPS